MNTTASLIELFNNLVSKRQSVRGYLPQPIERDKLDRIIEAARLAPSACNAQPWKFIVVDNPEIKNSIADATSSRVLGMNHFTKQAPVHIVVILEGANFKSSFGSLAKRKYYPLMDIGIAVNHICLAATAEELGSCIIGWFVEKRVKKILNIPRGKRPLLIITLGYPSNQEIREKKRKTIEEIVGYNGYDGKTN